MIEESYVSFETAKLLKEAGFDEVCRWAYDEAENSVVMHEKNSMLSPVIFPVPHRLWRRGGCERCMGFMYHLISSWILQMMLTVRQ